VALKLSILLEAVDRLSGPIGRVQARLAGVAARARALGAASGADRLAASLGRVAGVARQAGGAIAAVAVPVAALAAAGGALAGVGAIRGAAAMERYAITLRQVEGSAEAARRALDWVSDFATRTPFELDEVARAYVNLRNLGLDPTRGALQAAGDAAAIMGTRFDEAVTAMAAAMRGEMDPLERFGVFARTEGENIVMEWEHQGRRLRAVVEKTNREMLARMIQTAWAQKFGGGMQQLSRSWTGMMSNLADAWARFQLAVMNAGVFAWLQSRLQQLLATIDRLQADGTLQRWASAISAELVRAGTVIEDFLLGRQRMIDAADGGGVVMLREGGVLRGVAQVVRLLGEAFEGVRGVLAPIVGDFGAFEAAMALLALKITAPFINLIWSFGAALAGVGMALATTPIGWAIMAIAALAALGLTLHQNWQGVAEWFARQWEGITAAVSAAADAIERVLNLLPRLPQREGGTLLGPEGAARRRENLRNNLLNLPGLSAEDRARLGADLPPLEGQGGAFQRMSAPGDQRVDLGGTLRIRIEDRRVNAEGRLNDPRARLDVDQGLLLGTI
jgi:hypothetical protein